ncbi:MAG TPA: serpin family protein [Candidatus Eisenbacteria bacterium]|nr:serpin family protein [Candidatus Eisenbacteria bacterium]
MKDWKWGLAFLLLVGCVNVSVHTGSKASASGAVADSAMAPAINAFALDLYHFMANEPGNVICSPLSISTLLASLTPGAVGPTQTEMLKVLHRTASAGAGDRALLSGLESQARADSTAWTLANRSWVEKDYQVSPAFAKTTHDLFGYEMGEADFVHEPDASRAAINQWIEQQTHGHIRDLFPQGSIESATRLVLANAIYFKGLWASPFRAENTKSETFYADGKDAVSVPMMSRGGSIRFAKLAHARMIELPYRGDHLSMLVILPDDRNGIGALEQSIEAGTLNAWVSQLRAHEVDLKLPRFKSEGKWNLKPVLNRLGMRAAFDPAKANFSAIAKGHDLFLGAVYHGAFVEVNEEGTEAAAASGGVMATTSIAVPESFTADHPFFYVIRDRTTGCILFMGRLTDPRG